MYRYDPCGSRPNIRRSGSSPRPLAAGEKRPCLPGNEIEGALSIRRTCGSRKPSPPRMDRFVGLHRLCTRPAVEKLWTQEKSLKHRLCWRQSDTKRRGRTSAVLRGPTGAFGARGALTGGRKQGTTEPQPGLGLEGTPRGLATPCSRLRLRRGRRGCRCRWGRRCHRRWWGSRRRRHRRRRCRGYRRHRCRRRRR